MSLLVDTRAAAGGSAAWTQALTIRGEASIVEDPAMSTAWIDRLARKHSELTNLAKDPTVCLIEVRLTHILFLENVDKGCDVAL